MKTADIAKSVFQVHCRETTLPIGRKVIDLEHPLVRRMPSILLSKHFRTDEESMIAQPVQRVSLSLPLHLENESRPEVS